MYNIIQAVLKTRYKTKTYNIGKLSSPVFRELLALGIIPAELHWMNRESDKNAA